MIQRFSELFGRLKTQASPWEMAYELQDYVARAVAWVFTDRLHRTGYFQHSFTPDFYVHLESGQKLAIHLRFNLFSLQALLVQLQRTSRRSTGPTKHVVLVADSALVDHPNTHVPSHLLRNKNCLVTSFELVDRIHGLIEPIEELGIDQVRARLQAARRKVETWVLTAHGWQAPMSLGELILPLAERSAQRKPLHGHFSTFYTSHDFGRNLPSYLASESSLALRRHTSDQFPTEDRKQQQLLKRINRYGTVSAVVANRGPSVWHPLLAVVFSTHAPMGQNPFQLFPQAVAAATEGVPFFLVTPDKLGVVRDDGHWTNEEMSPLFYHALGRLTDIYNVPALALPWSTVEDTDGFLRLRHDQRYVDLPSRSDSTIQLLYKCIDISIKAHLDNFSPAKMLMGYQGLTRRRLEMEDRSLARGTSILEQPGPKSGFILPTVELARHFRDSLALGSVPKLPRLLRGRQSSLIFYNSSVTLRPDPYAGTMMMYDFCFCRSGRTVMDRVRNLVVHFRSVSCADAVRTLFIDRSLQTPRSVRVANLFLHFADVLAFKDGMIVRTDQDKWVRYPE